MTDRRITGRYATLDAGLVPDCPGLRGRENPELYHTRKEVKKRVETKMIRCLDMALRRLTKVEKRVEMKMIWYLSFYSHLDFREYRDDICESQKENRNENDSVP